ncbi:hypothetical protein PG985_003920 [Apiospora marii]|uniref:uncharacterized protein n=1 Tax=Apiospora marii TaxID=335849 RepID=UPI00313076B9
MDNSPPQYSAQPSAAPKLYEHVLRKKYRSQVKLKQSLDDMFGEGKWQVKVCAHNPRQADSGIAADSFGNLSYERRGG